MAVRVASARESVSADAAAVAMGIPARALMRAAAAGAAGVLADRFGDRLHLGVTVFAGPGNNGGDGWAVAAALARAGVRVSVDAAAPPRTDDARAEAALAGEPVGTGDRPCGIAIDALLGTGSRGAPAGDIADGLERLRQRAGAGAAVVALDVPTGLDATTGAFPIGVPATCTVTFGSVKRGQLVSRAACGTLVVVDIGLPDRPELPELVDARWVAPRVPAIAADATKGTRGRVAVIAGAAGMGGAALTAAEGALRAGAGLVKVATAAEHGTAVHARLPEVLTATLTDAASAAVAGWGDATLIGPGLGTAPETRPLVERVLAAAQGRGVVLDADALNAFAGDVDGLREALAGRPAILTPHPLEFARLAGVALADVLDARFDIGCGVAARTGAVVLLKGTPTVIATPDGVRLVVARGTPLLATGGSGDALGGMIATLLAQGARPADAAAVAAWVHGRAAELCGAPVRGRTLGDVLRALPDAWVATGEVAPRYPVLAELPVVP